MIQFTTGNILRDDADAIVNTVNCVGVMGRGIALQFKKAWPENFKKYEEACRRGEVRPGRMFVFETGRLTPPRFIINFPTKRHWRGDSRIEDIEAGLIDLVRIIRENKITSIALPPLGSGLGGLDWPLVRARIEEALAALPEVDIRVYEPSGVFESERPPAIGGVPQMTGARAALVGLMHRYLAGLLDPLITLLEVHKLMYFLQEAGEPLRLRYVKAQYGPYAENLRHLLHAVEGYMVSGYYDGGDAPGKPISLVPGAIEDATAFLAANSGTSARVDRVQRLVQGFESPFGLELLSTVHWVIKHETHSERLEDVVDKTWAWNSRKRQFTERQIGIAIRVLNEEGWIKPDETISNEVR